MQRKGGRGGNGRVDAPRVIGVECLLVNIPKEAGPGDGPDEQLETLGLDPINLRSNSRCRWLGRMGRDMMSFCKPTSLPSRQKSSKDLPKPITSPSRA